MPGTRRPDVTVRCPAVVDLLGDPGSRSWLPVLAIAVDRRLVVGATAAPGPVLTAAMPGVGEVSVSRDELRLKGPGWGHDLVAIANAVSDLAPGRGAAIELSGELVVPGSRWWRTAFAVGVLAALDGLWGTALSRDQVAARAAAATGEAGMADALTVAFAEHGAALRIEFAPPATRPVPLPEGLAFVVAVPVAVAERPFPDQRDRIIGARLAAALLCETIGIDAGSPPRLADVAGFSEAELLAEELPERASPAWVSKGTGILAQSLAALDSGGVNVRADVPVRRYARHALSEAARVDAAEQALLRNDLQAFGSLLDASDRSRRDELGGDTSELDAACAAMRSAGAFGARQTESGLACAAAPAGQVEAILAAVNGTGGVEAFAVQASGAYSLE